eukprot:1822454-Prymnesium_polylepis.1
MYEEPPMVTLTCGRPSCSLTHAGKSICTQWGANVRSDACNSQVVSSSPAVVTRSMPSKNSLARMFAS